MAVFCIIKSLYILETLSSDFGLSLTLKVSRDLKGRLVLDWALDVSSDPATLARDSASLVALV